MKNVQVYLDVKQYIDLQAKLKITWFHSLPRILHLNSQFYFLQDSNDRIDISDCKAFLKWYSGLSCMIQTLLRQEV